MNRVHIIVIDDEEMILSLATKVLQRAGIQVSTAMSGSEGLALVLSNPEAHAAIIDMTMPDIDGFELIRRIRQHRPAFPCILSTWHALSPKDIPSDISGHMQLLLKPYRSQALVEVVSRAASDSLATAGVNP